MLEITPLVGMGITYSIGSDRYAGTITRVSKTGKTFYFRNDDVNPGPNYDYYRNQVYIYSPSDKQPEQKAFYQKGSKRFRVSGHETTGLIRLNERKAYSDPHF